MRWIAVFILATGGLDASAKSLRCVADWTANFGFGFESADFSESAPFKAYVTIPGLFSAEGTNRGLIEMEFLNLSRTGYADYRGVVYDPYRRYVATMWLNQDRQDDTGRFRGRITIHAATEIDLNLNCRVNP